MWVENRTNPKMQKKQRVAWPELSERNRSRRHAGSLFALGARKLQRGGIGKMRKRSIAIGTVLALAAGPAMAQGSVKIGFIDTFSGPTAVIGNDMRNSFELALDHLGRNMGGLPVEVIDEDEQQKPEVGA